jgi:hypothetical protein
MIPDKKIVLQEIDTVLGQATTAGAPIQTFVSNATALLSTAIQRLSPPGSQYLRLMYAAFESHETPWGMSPEEHAYQKLRGILQALRADWEADRLKTFTEIVTADLFSDFLEQAEYLLSEGYKDAAAVMAGGVLEQHLRKLCDTHGISTTTTDSKSGKDVPLKLDRLNGELAKQQAYPKNDQKQVTAWADIRNDAAHGHYAKYTREQVDLMVQWVRDFMGRNPS